MRFLLAALLVASACNSAERPPAPLAACGADNPCADGASCVDGMCVARLAPETMLVATPPELSNTPNPEFMFQAQGEATSFLCALDGEVAVACQPPFAVTVAEGEHVFLVYALGPGGEDVTPAIFHWTVDLTPPETMIAAGPEGPVNSAEAVFALGASEVVEYQCSLDGADFGPCAESWSALAEGEHVLLVKSRDRAGNLDETPAERRWLVDLTPPLAAFELQPADPTNAIWAQFRFRATEERLRWVYQLEDAPEVATPEQGVELEVTAGRRTLRLWAVDLAGNRSAEPAAFSWTVDTTQPDTTIDEKPPARTRSTAATFRFRSSKPEGARFRCRLDDGDSTACDSGSITYAGPLAARAHSFEVYAIDASNNQDPVAARAEWTIDTTPPAVAIQSPVGGSTTGKTFELRYTKGDAVDCSVDGGSWLACPASPSSRSFVGGGAKSLRIRVRDDVGNEAEARVDWTVDGDGPTLTVSAPAEGSTTGPRPILTYDKGDASECRVNGSGWIACPVSGTELGVYPDGAATYTIQGRDRYLNEGAAVVRRWTVDAAGPDVTISEPVASSTTGKAPRLVYDKKDATECSVNDGPFGPCPVSGSALGPYPSGSRTYKIAGRDVRGNVGTPASVTWTVDADPPTLTINSPLAGQWVGGPGVNVSYTATGASYCIIDGGPHVPCDRTVPKNYDTEGTKTITMRAGDAYGNETGDVTRTFNVDLNAPTVTITSCPATITYDGAITFTASDTSPVGTSCTVDAQDVSCSGGAYRPRGIFLGSHSFTVRATDSVNRSATASCDFRLKPGPGHVVLFGHDLYNVPLGHTVEQVLLNALHLTEIDPSRTDIMVTLFTGRVTAQEYERFRVFLPAPFRPMEAPTPPQVMALLSRTNVLVIFDQNAPQAAAEALAYPGFIEALRRFYNDGGVIIILDGMAGGSVEIYSENFRFWNALGLTQVGAPRPSPSALRSSPIDTELAASVPGYAAPLNTVFYSAFSSVMPGKVFEYHGAPIVIHAVAP